MPSLAGERWWRQPPKGGGISLARQGGCMVFAAKGGIKMAPKAPYLPSGAVLHTSRGREPSTRPGGVSRSRTEPLAPRAKGPAAPSTLARESGRQPSGILKSTAQDPVPISTAPQAPEPSFKNSARHLTASGQRLYLTSRISLRRLLFPLLLWFFLLS